MENWLYELEKAYKKGVTVGYANGTADATREALPAGYVTGIHDVLDILEKYQSCMNAELFVRIINELEAIQAVRKASGVYIKDDENH